MTEADFRRTRAAERRVRIREAAKRLFLRLGFDGVSTDAIVGEAGIASKETLYRYYRSKEELFVDVIRSMTVEGPHLGGVIGRPPSPSTQAELGRILRAFVREVLETMLQPDYQALMRVTIASLPAVPELGALFRDAVPARALAWLRALVRRGQEAGWVRRGRDPEAVARMVLGLPLTYAILDGLMAKGPPRLPGASVIAAAVQNVLHGISVKGGDKE